jgi:hypothetical protein
MELTEWIKENQAQVQEYLQQQLNLPKPPDRNTEFYLWSIRANFKRKESYINTLLQGTNFDDMATDESLQNTCMFVNRVANIMLEVNPLSRADYDLSCGY